MSKLGDLIRTTRQTKQLGLRELARRVDRSPAYIVSLELSDVAPGVSQDTLQRVATALDLEVDQLLILAGKVPDDANPRDEVDLTLYRLVRLLPEARKQRLVEELETEIGASRTRKQR